MPFCEGTDTRVHYETGGDGPVLLMLNGLVASAFLWPRAWLDRFERAYTVVRVSNRGTGHTAAGDRVTIEAMAADALAVLDLVGADRAHVLGYSMGGMVAQSLTLSHPERVAALVLCSTTTGGAADAHPEFLGALAGAGGSAERAAGSFFHLLAGPGFLETNPQVVDELATGWLEAPTRAETTPAQLAAAATFDVRERLSELDKATLVLHGTEDRLIVPAAGERLASLIAGARLEIFHGAGHLLPFEVPERSGVLIQEFLTGVPVTAG